MTGVTKKTTRMTLPTICATSRKRAQTVPSSRPTQTALATTSASAGTSSSACSPAATPKRTATPTYTSPLWAIVRRFSQTSLKTNIASGRLAFVIHTLCRTNTVQLRLTAACTNCQAMKPSATCGR